MVTLIQIKAVAMAFVLVHATNATTMPSQKPNPIVQTLVTIDLRSIEQAVVLERGAAQKIPCVNCISPRGIEGGDSSHGQTAASLGLQEPFYLTQSSSTHSASHTESKPKSKSKSKSKAPKSSHHSTRTGTGSTHQPTGSNSLHTPSNSSHAVITGTQFYLPSASLFPLLSSNSSSHRKHNSTLHSSKTYKPKKSSNSTNSIKPTNHQPKVTATITKMKTKQEMITKWYSATPKSSIAAVSQLTVTSCGVTPCVSNMGNRMAVMGMGGLMVWIGIFGAVLILGL